MAKPSEYVALLRGLNVGGSNIIKMTDLVACFTELGFGAVRTYIQSGNVLFSANAEDSAKLTRRIEAGLAERFGYDAAVVVRSRKQLASVVARAPEGFGSRPKTYRYDVLFLMPPLTPREALAVLPRKEGVDEVFGGAAEIYFSRLIAKATQSRLSRVVGLPIYKSLTIRNWNTTTKLLQLMNASER
jgi:uncharacterized protein (DUF1697 family)